MKTDDFEQRLVKTPLRPPPAAWRAEILGAAEEARAGWSSAPGRQRVEGGMPEWLRRWRALLGQMAGPWTVPAGACAVLLLVNGLAAGVVASHPDPTPGTVVTVPWPKLIAAGRQYRAEVTALAAPETADVDTSSGDSRALPRPDGDRPRSDWLPDLRLRTEQSVCTFV